MGRYGKDDQRFAGIYKIINTTNGKIYVGQSKNVYERRKEHFSALYNGTHENKQMQKDGNETNGIGFRGSVVELCGLKLLNEREKYWIDTLNTLEPRGYNKGGVPYKRKEQTKHRKPSYHKTR